MDIVPQFNCIGNRTGLRQTEYEQELEPALERPKGLSSVCKLLLLFSEHMPRASISRATLKRLKQLFGILHIQSRGPGDF